MASEEKTSAADIPLKSHEEVTSAAEFLLKSHEEVTSAVDIPLKSHQERVPWTMASREKTSAASIPLKSHEECVSCRTSSTDHQEVSLNINEIATSLSDHLNTKKVFSRACCIYRVPARLRKLNKECKRLFKFYHRMEIAGTSSTDQQIMDRSHEVSLDINEIATSLRDQLKTNKAFSSTCCIYRVPETLRELNEKAFAPRVVSIGPIHHGKENLKDVEDHKIMYLQQFLERSKVSVEDLINIVKDNETKLRDCYAETIDLSRKDFATMILLDAVFVIMVLLKWNCVGESRGSRIGDQIFFRPWKLKDARWDMCLLENQLPFFILEELLERYSAAGANPRNRTVIELTSLFLSKSTFGWVKEDSWKTIDSSEVLHFVDFIRKCLQPTEQNCEERGMVILSAPTATKLHQSGVKFKKSGSKSLLDIRFSDGILEIPQLEIHGHTETLFRNLQAFEQCHYLNEKDIFISDYITFIGCLVHAPNDVEVLAHNENLKMMFYSNEAVSNLVHNLDKHNVVTRHSIFSGVFKNLNSHCEKPWHQWKANLKQDYFKNPWTAISVAAAAFLLILTVTQTVCSILQL